MSAIVFTIADFFWVFLTNTYFQLTPFNQKSILKNQSILIDNQLF